MSKKRIVLLVDRDEYVSLLRAKLSLESREGRKLSWLEFFKRFMTKSKEVRHD